MPKKISKSMIQKVNQKQTVNINIPVPKRRKTTRSKSISLPITNGQVLHTGTMLSSNYIPSGHMHQIGHAFKEPILQIHHKIGRMERTIDDLLSNVSNTRYIKADPKPIVRPIDEPQAYDNGFVDRTEMPMPFLENSIRRAPMNMEDIPVPQQGMWSGDPMVKMENEEMKSNQKNRLTYDNVLTQQNDIRQQMNVADYGVPPPSPYEKAEYKIAT